MPRIARNPVLVSFSLSIATALLVLCCLSPGTFQHLHRIVSSNLFLHLLFNSIIVVIVAKEHFGRSRNELDKGFPLFHFAYEMEEHGGKIGSEDEDGDYTSDLESCGDRAKDRSDDNDNEDYDDDDDDHGSDGYDEDDDDSGSYAEMGWEDEDDDEEEYDSELERRVEAFIAKVINGWREEWFSDNMQD